MLGERMEFCQQVTDKGCGSSETTVPSAPGVDTEEWHKHPRVAAATLLRAQELKFWVVTSGESSNPPPQKKKKKSIPEIKGKRGDSWREGWDWIAVCSVWEESVWITWTGYALSSENQCVFPLKERYGWRSPPKKACWLSLDLICSPQLYPEMPVWTLVCVGFQLRNCPCRQWINPLSRSVPGGYKYADAFKSIHFYISLLSKNILMSPLKGIL